MTTRPTRITVRVTHAAAPTPSTAGPATSSGCGS
jgi:hypothetical protein